MMVDATAVCVLDTQGAYDTHGLTVFKCVCYIHTSVTAVTGMLTYSGPTTARPASLGPPLLRRVTAASSCRVGVTPAYSCSSLSGWGVLTGMGGGGVSV